MKKKLDEIKSLGQRLAKLENEFLDELKKEFKKHLGSKDLLNLEMYYDEEDGVVRLKIDAKFWTTERNFMRKAIRFQAFVLDFADKLKLISEDYSVDNLSMRVNFEFKY